MGIQTPAIALGHVSLHLKKRYIAQILVEIHAHAFDESVNPLHQAAVQWPESPRIVFHILREETKERSDHRILLWSRITFGDHQHPPRRDHLCTNFAHEFRVALK